MRAAVLSALTLWLVLGTAAEERVALSFELVDGWAILLEGTLGGIPHQRLLLDTAAVPSAINIRIARRLKLDGPVQKLSLMNRVMAVERIKVPDVRVGAISVEGFEMVALDLSRIEQALGTTVDAVIGLDLLGKSNFSLDYRHKELIFDSHVVSEQATPFEIGQEAGGTYILIPLESGGQRLKMLVDTGTKDLMLFTRRLRGPLKQLRARGRSFNLNAGGGDRLLEVEMPRINVGPSSYCKRQAYLWNVPEDNFRPFDGLLGPRALGVALVSFDFDRHLVSFAYPSKTGE
jgi:hypothetical protein